MADRPPQGRTEESAIGPAGRKRLGRRTAWLAVGGFLLLALLAAVYWYLFLRGVISTDDAFIQGDKVSVSSKILGGIVELTADEGDSVRQGEILAALDSADLKAQEAEARAGLEAARHDVDLSRIHLQRAQDDFRRATVQYRSNVIPKEDWQHSQQTLEAARVERDRALSQVNLAEARLNVVRTQLANTQIYSPFDGVVAKRWALAGDVVQPGQPIFAVYKPGSIWVTANFEETKLHSIRPGDRAQLSVDAYPGHRFEGNILFMGAAAASEFSLIPPNNASGNFTKVTQRVPVRLSIRETGSDPDGAPVHLVPGMSVTVTIRTDRERHP